MAGQKSHAQAFIDAASEDVDSAAFLFGYVMRDLPDDLLCRALNALSAHKLELLALEQRNAEERLEALEKASD